MRAVIYLRISLDRLGDGLAIDRQREDCESIVQARGWELVETYTDQSISASDAKKNRPAYNRMVEDWHRGRYDAIVCWDLDRLTRQPRQLEDWIDAAEKGGLRLVTANGEADLGVDAGRMFARIKAAVARQEVERKSARQKRAAQQRAQQGKPWGARRAFGYTQDRSELNEPEATAAREMYREYLAGTSQREIARRLNAAGLTTTMGGPWRQTGVREFLRSPRNAGLRTYRGEVVGPGNWPPLVSEATWRATVQRMDDQAPASTRRGGVKYLLPGILRCAVCDAPTRTGYAANGNRQYVCPNRHMGRSAEVVDAYVSELVVQRLQREPASMFRRSEQHDAEALAAEADALRARLDSLATEFADGVLTASQLRTATERTRANLEAVTGRMASMHDDPTLGELVTAKDVRAVWDGLDLGRRRSVVSALMELHLERGGRGVRFSPEQLRVTWKTGDDD